MFFKEIELCIGKPRKIELRLFEIPLIRNEFRTHWNQRIEGLFMNNLK